MKKKMKMFLLMILALAILGTAGSAALPCYAASEDTEKEGVKKDPYELDKQVKEWLDAGNGIPGDAKYATLQGTTHLWEIDSADISDGKVELSGVNEKRLVYGIELRTWLKTQFFYGDNFNNEDNRKKFVRPGSKKDEF